MYMILYMVLIGKNLMDKQNFSLVFLCIETFILTVLTYDSSSVFVEPILRRMTTKVELNYLKGN